MPSKIRCTDCESCKLEARGSRPARYYCTKPKAQAALERMEN